jgi:hypothetical protein
MACRSGPINKVYQGAPLFPTGLKAAGPQRRTRGAAVGAQKPGGLGAKKLGGFCKSTAFDFFTVRRKGFQS